MMDRLPDPEELPGLALKNKEPNKSLIKRIRALSAADIDNLFTRHYLPALKQSDCITCANCCKTLEAGLDESEIARLAHLKSMAITEFRKKVMQHEFNSPVCFLTAPCTFLSPTNHCTIYTERPGACADFPGLERPGIRFRLRTVLANYSVCPIVYGTVEGIRKELMQSDKAGN